MGLNEDMIKMSLAKNHMAELLEDFRKDKTCNICGRHFDKTTGGRCMKGGFGCDKENLCSKCMKVCKSCGKVFCSKHINNHKCK